MLSELVVRDFCYGQPINDYADFLAKSTSIVLEFLTSFDLYSKPFELALERSECRLIKFQAVLTNWQTQHINIVSCHLLTLTLLTHFFLLF